MFVKCVERSLSHFSLVVAVFMSIGTASSVAVSACDESGAWIQSNPSAVPSARFGFGMTYDAIRQQVLVFGGEAAPSVNSRLSDTWIWDGITWSQVVPTTSPGPRTLTVMAFDDVRQEVVLFGGFGPSDAMADDTWIWDGTDWSVKSLGVHPPGLGLACMAFDYARDETVLFGGQLEQGPPYTRHGGTWTWDGSIWIQRFPEHAPSPRAGAGMTFDRVRNEIVLFGGVDQSATTLSDTWTWNGSDWTEESPAVSPGAHSSMSLAFDAQRGKVIMFGGGNGVSTLNSLWIWDGSDWIEECQGPYVIPEPRIYQGMVYDAAASKIRLFGGINGQTSLDDIWVWPVIPNPATCLFEAQDVNCDSVIDILDVVRTVGVAFRSEPAGAPCCPYQ